jgi:hypothetical protein
MPRHVRWYRVHRTGPCGACFHAPAGALDGATVPWDCSSQVHPCLTLLLFRVPAPNISARNLSDSGPPAWVSSLFATSRERVHHASLPKASLRSVHRRSQPHDGLLRARASRLVSSRSRVQGTFPVQGLLSSRSHPPSSGGACPLAVVTVSLAGRDRQPRRRASASRLFSARRRVPAKFGV